MYKQTQLCSSLHFLLLLYFHICAFERRRRYRTTWFLQFAVDRDCSLVINTTICRLEKSPKAVFYQVIHFNL